MLSDASLAAIDAHWAADLGCTVEALRSSEGVVTPHGRGIFIFSRGGTVVAVPPAFADGRVLGPNFVGYLDQAIDGGDDDAGARLLDAADADAVDELRAACEPVAWENGVPSRAAMILGVFRGAALEALASYEIWSERIAHIGIITHPAHRGHGLGTAAVRAMTRIALAQKLVAQYLTPLANAPSMAIARRLGFQRYASIISIPAHG